MTNWMPTPYFPTMAIAPYNLNSPLDVVGGESPYEQQTIVGERLYEALEWLPGDQTLLWYEDAIGALFEPTAAIVVGQGDDGDEGFQPGYGVLFTVNPRFVGDVAYCATEDLGYVAQFAGVKLPPSVDDATARSLITSEAGQNRGTPAAIIAAAQRYLDNTQAVDLVERRRSDGSMSAYAFTLIVRPEEVENAADLVAAVNAVKPGGVMWQLVQSDGQTWVADSGEWIADAGSWSAD